MLAPRAASAFVCIRCELKLARTALSSPSLPSLSRPPSRANFSALSPRRDAFDDAAAQRLDNTPPPRPKASEHPLGKIRKRKGKAALRESTAQLAGVKTLGKDSEILVLEEIGSAAKPNEPPEPEALVSLEQKDEDAQRAGGILASLEAEGVELGEEESNQQLDNLRPSTHSTTSPDEPHYITQADFLKLQKALIEGFSVKQLSRYFSVRKGIHQGAVTTEIINNLSIPGTAKGAVARSEWSPGTSPLSRRLPGSLGLRGPKRKPVSKRALVDQLLRSVWNLVLLEEIEAPGEIEMTLKLWQLVLLTTGATTPLDRVGNQRKAKIEVHWPHSVIRITADKSTAEYTANDVESLLQSTQLQKLSLKPWMSYLPENVATKGKPTSLFSEDALQTVQRLSGATVQIVTNDTLSIRALDKHSIQEAQRFLIRLLPVRSSSAQTIDHERLSRHTNKAYLQPSYMKSSLSYRFRAMDIGRWTLPIQKSNEIEVPIAGQELPEIHSNSAAADAELYSRTFAALKQPLQIISSQPKSIKTTNGAVWLPQAHEHISAKFGQALFSMNHGGATAADAPWAAFQVAVPALSKVLLKNHIQPSHGLPPQLLYTFTPSPQQANSLDKLEDYPALTVRFMQTNGNPQFRDLYLNFKDRYYDVLLPDLATDIRFIKRFKLGLSTSRKEPKIASFITAVKDNIQSGARLTAPASLTIEVPKWTIPGYKRDNIGTRTIEYLFTEVTHRQNVNMTFHGQPVSIAVIQKGKVGGNSTRLAVHYNFPDQSKGPDLVNDWEELGRFVKSSFALADCITEAAADTTPTSDAVAHTLPPTPQATQANFRAHKPRAPDSARKLRRQFEVGRRDKGGTSAIDMLKDLSAQNERSKFLEEVAPEVDAKDIVLPEVEFPKNNENPSSSSATSSDWPIQPSEAPESDKQSTANDTDNNELATGSFTDASTRLAHDSLDDPRLMDLLRDDDDPMVDMEEHTEAQKKITLTSSG